MSDRRIDVVAGVLESLPPGMDPELFAIAVISALDADACRRPFIGIVPPVRLWADRDRSGEVEEPEVTLEEAVAAVEATRHEGLNEFAESTTHNPEVKP